MYALHVPAHVLRSPIGGAFLIASLAMLLVACPSRAINDDPEGTQRDEAALIAADAAEATAPTEDQEAEMEREDTDDEGMARERAPEAGATEWDPEAEAERLWSLQQRLFNELAAGADNEMISAWSIRMALILAHEGTDGATREEIAEVLGFEAGADAELPLTTTAALLGMVDELAEEEGLTLRNANALWLERTISFHSEWRDTLSERMRAHVEGLDFRGSSEAARRTINQHVSDQTNGRIEELLGEGMVGSDTAAVLTNAVYFLADWASPFNAERTQDRAFTLASGDEIEVPTMMKRGSLSSVVTDDWTMIAMPYQGDRVQMRILMPSDPAAEAPSLETWRELNGMRRDREATLYMPSFEFGASYELIAVLRAMGMNAAFTDGVADFSRMSDGSFVISEIVHETFVRVDEEGTEAAAATGIGVRATSMPAEPMVIRLDRPFWFVIEEAGHGVPLFFGRLSDPR